jgi:plastocyanin
VIIFSREPAENPAPAVSVESDSLETPPAPIAAPIEQVTNGAEVTITGSVLFQGKIPQGKRLNLPAACAKNFKGPVYSNEVIVNNGKLQNVLVRVISGIEGKTFTDIPTKEVELDQHGCMYTPRVVGARVGQKVTFINSDPVFHNVRSITAVNQRFNMAMPTKGQRETKIFNKPETFLQAKCSVHPWMGAYVAVMDHPYFSVTNSQGEFTIKNLPEGKYTIEAWHEVYGTQKQEIAVTKNGMTPLTFIFK